MLNLIVVLLALVLTAIAVGVISWFFMGLLLVEPSPIRQRLQRLKQDQTYQDDGQPSRLLGRMVLQLEDASQSRWEPLLARFSVGQWLLKLVKDSKQTLNLDKMMVTWLIVPVGASFLLMLMMKSILPVFLSLLVPVLRVTMLVMARKKRMEALLRQFPDALIILSSALRAGHAFPMALQLSSLEVPSPLSDELGRLSQDINLGMTLHDSFDKLQRSVGYLPDFQLFATAVILQRETGGNLAEVLDQLSATIRERFKLKRQIASITAQPRMTGYLLGGAPLILLGVLTVIFYGYIQPMYETPIGNFGLVVAFVLQIIGFFVIRKLIDIKI